MSEEKIKQLENEVKELKKKLEDRNPAFNGNLLRKADAEFSRLQCAIGESIKNAVGQEMTYCFKSRPMRLEFDSSTYGGRGWLVYFNQEDEKKLKEIISDHQMKKFQESLDNYAWAVQNGGNQ